MLFHLYVFSGPLMVLISIILAVQGAPLEWWNATIIMTGAAIWDFGWHSWAHHRNLWTAHIAIRIAGFLLAVAGALL